MSSDKAQSEHRLHPFGIAVIGARRVRRFTGLLFPALAAAVVALGLPGVAAIGAFVVAVALVVGVAQWRAFTFVVDGDAFVVHRGVFEHETRTVPLTRVQSVDVHQGMLDRLAGARRLTVRTAAGTANVELPAVSAAAEGRLRRALGDTGEARDEDVVRALAPRELPLIAVTSPRVLGGIAILVAVANRLQDVLPHRLVVEAEDTVEPRSALALLLFAALVVAFTVLASLIGTFMTLYGFRVVRDGERLRLRRGLLNFRETVVPVARARAVVVLEGLAREPLRRCALSVRTAGRMGRGSQSSILFPLLRIGEAPAFVREVLPALDLEGVELERPPRRARGRFARRPALPWLVAAALATALWWPVGAIVLVAVPPALLLGLARFRAAGIGLREGRLRWRRRGIARRTVVARAHSVQWRRVRQSPFQRRRSLATLEVGLAASGIDARVPDLDARTAARLARALDPRSLAGERD
jgi:putative membrane protein